MNKGRILFIEDYPVISRMYAQTLGGYGFNVYVANNGTDALVQLLEKTFDVILLDLIMPRKGGMEFLASYSKRGGETPIIVLTDFDDPKIIAKAKELGAQEYWMKVDHTPYELAQKIEKFLKKRASEDSK